MIEVKPLPEGLNLDATTRGDADALIVAIVERANASAMTHTQAVSALTAALAQFAYGVDLSGLKGMALAAGMGQILQLTTMQLERLEAGESALPPPEPEGGG